MSDSSGADGSDEVARAAEAASEAAAGAASASSDPVAAATGVAGGALGVADAAGVEGASEAAAVVGAAGTVASSAAELEHDPVGGLLGVAGGAASAVGAAGVAPEATQAVTAAAGAASSVVGAASSASRAASSVVGAAPVASAAAPPTAATPAASAPATPASAVAEVSNQASWLIGSADRLHTRFTFWTEQDSGWRVRRISLEERLDTPYECVIDLTHDDATIDPLTLLGQPAVVTIERHAPRDLQGVVRRVERGAGGGADRAVSARITLVPALWTLSRTRNTRVFQELSVPEILQEILEAGLGAFQREVTLDLQNTYPPREYCVQWEESDLDFCHRLMQEEGIWYHFDFSGDTEKMVIGDTASSFVGLETQDGLPVPFSPLSQGSGPVEAVTEMLSTRQLVPNKTVVREYDWTRPRTDFLGEAELTGDAAASTDESAMEEYVHGPVVTFSEYGDPQFGGDDTAKQADLIKRRRATEIEIARVSSELTLVSPGMTFELAGHPLAELDRTWLVVAVRHEGSGAAEGGGDDAPEYVNHIELIPAEIDWRPKRTLFKRRHHSVLTATVVGPEGEEIYTDVHGRIKVQFHWDRLGERNERSSCFVRSMQPWAGPSWGFVFLPRIGMEVVVTFVDGDMDRPLVIGSVYNGVNPPPYALPDERTKSSIKTNSSPGGDGYNELRFEDAAGHEEVFIHAQKDMNEVVENNHSRSVGADESISVGGNRTKSVDKNETITITGHQSITVTGEGEPGDGAVRGGQMNITGKYKLDANDEILVQAPNKITLTCGGSTLVMEPGKITLTSGGNATMVLDANALVEASGHGKVFLDANANLHASGGGDILLDANAVMHSNAGSHVTLDGNATMHANAGAQVALTADAVMGGANATMNGDTAATVSAPTATLAGGSGSVEASASGVSASGPTVNIAGQGSTSISGAVVKIN